ncbi:rhamnan synthesis protein F [Actinomyces oris]|uniref:Rhamnan synthesis F family protein n=1 Tax=Actinomyces oris TaxID=544580 RepID=A0AAW8LD81_9ACTO|nr:rhamnan synthesis F family protein [Actinomyces oris]MDR0178396.1 rhamnan synthesis F family protein [Actinomyces oris]OLO78646.1 rhamnan synthesis protein F [Actinomyces oris]
MNRGLVYFHFDPHHQVRDYVVAALSSLRPHANHILLVSNSPISEVDRARLATCCDEILPRPNEGLDAGAYRAGLEHLGWERLADFDELILTNHTYYAPLRPWEEVLTRAAGWGDISFWGMTEHATMRPHPFLAQRELPRHLQSHWISVRRRLLTDPAFREYWEQMPPVSSYRDSIQWHESRFTGHFAELGHTWQVAFPVDRYRSENPAIEEAPALLADGCPLLKRRALFHDPLHQDRQAVVGGELLEAAARAGYSEDLILSDVVHTAAARDLIVNAGLTEVVTGCVPGAAGAGAETSSPERRPTGCVVVHVPAGREALERAEADGLARRLASLPAHWRVVVTSPERLDAADLERVTGRRPSQEDTQEDSAHGEGDVSFRLVRDLDPRGTIAFLTQCDDLWDPGRGDDGDEGGDGGPLVLRITVGPPPVPGTRADDVAHRQALDCLLDSPGYTAGLIDLFARHPGLGVAMPAAGHIGQAHGGPTWDGLAGAAKALSRRLGLSAELDPLAPVAPPGAMFMARPEALRTLSEGAKELVRLTDQAAAGAEQSAERLRRARAAEVLELLTVYAAMSSGFHPREVLTPVWAGRLYGALAYKHRVVTADLPAHTDEQVRFLQARFGPLAGVGARVRTYVDVHHPDMGSALKPAYRYLTGGASGLARAATSAGRRLRGVGRHREEDKGD